VTQYLRDEEIKEYNKVKILNRMAWALVWLGKYHKSQHSSQRERKLLQIKAEYTVG
jgi:hypothetical protein